ncbi:MAG: hypothetical protein AAF899_11635 [Pseudomonadota bacterium]
MAEMREEEITLSAIDLSGVAVSIVAVGLFASAPEIAAGGVPATDRVLIVLIIAALFTSLAVHDPDRRGLERLG